MGESVYLLRGNIVNQVQGVGFPRLRELVDKILGPKVSYLPEVAKGIGRDLMG